MNKNVLTLAQVDALTNTELINAITETETLTVKAIRRMRHDEKVKVYWAQLKEQKLADEPKPVEQPKAETTATPKAGKICACGCEGMTKGGTWLPGHDAKAHSARLATEGKLKHAPKLCLCGCKEWTKGGTFRPGHDSRFYSSLHKTANIGLDIAKPHVGQSAFMPETLNPAEVALINVAA